MKSKEQQKYEERSIGQKQMMDCALQRASRQYQANLNIYPFATRPMQHILLKQSDIYLDKIG